MGFAWVSLFGLALFFWALLVAELESPNVFLKAVARDSCVVGFVASTCEISDFECGILVELSVPVEVEDCVSRFVVDIDPSGRIRKGVGDDG